MTSTTISVAEAFKQFGEIKKAAADASEQELQKELDLYGIDRNDKDMQGVIAKILDSLQNKKLLEISTLRNLNSGKAVKLEGVMNKLETIRSNIYFYVTLAYMRKQERINRNVLNLNRWVVGLTIGIILLMLLQIVLMICGRL